MTDSSKLSTYKMYTIGWIAALDKELTAALAMLDETHVQPDDFEQNDKDSNNYSWGRVGDHNIVIASLGGGSYGLVSAATTATCMANSLPHLRFGLLVGIGAGVPDLEENDVRLGDVVVSLPKNGHPGVVQYDLGKIRENDQFQRVGALAPPPTVLLKAVDKLRAEQRLKGSKLPEILSQAVQNYPMLANPKGRDPAFIYQGAENDRLFEPTSLHVSGGISCQNLCGGIKRRRIGNFQSCDGCDARGEIEREERPTNDPEIHYGTIASGNLVIKDGIFRDQILERLGTDVLCYEMEAAGLMNNFPCLVIRGICDYADTHKNDRWQNYAALVAAAYAKDLVCVIEARSIEKATKLEELMTSVSRQTSQIISATANTHQAVQGLTNSRRSQKLHRWLCAPDPSVNFNWAISQHLSGTGEWFLESEEYRRWKTSPGSSLWLYGIPGCGKTILSSAIIHNLKQVSANKHLLFFYFTFTATSKQSLDGAIRSLIGQLCSKSRPAEEYLVSLMASEYDDGSTQPNTASLCDAFQRITQMCDEIYIVLDALDECNQECNFKNEGCLTWLKSLLGSKHCNLHLLITSRREHKIQIVFDECIPNQICLQTDTVDNDIRIFIDTAIRTWDGLKAWHGHDHVQKEIRDYLTENSRGMFRWVSCQLNALAPLQGCWDYEALMEALKSLPKTLDETYAKILSRVPDVLRTKTHRILQFLLYSDEPLILEEAVEIVRIPCKIRQPNRISLPLVGTEMDTISIYCSDLVECVSKPGKKTGTVIQTLQLAHFSVKEYLFSSRTTESIHRALEGPCAYASMANICLAYLLEIDYDQAATSISISYPFAEHAAKYWVQYARRADPSMILELVSEFISHERHYKAYCQIVDHLNRRCLKFACGIAPPQGDRNPLGLRNTHKGRYDLPSSYPMLYFFALKGLSFVVKAILQMDAAACNVQGGYYGNPLQVASFEGYVDIVQILLGSGAHVNAQGGCFGTALVAAVHQGHEEVVKVLLDWGADAKSPDGILCYVKNDHSLGIAKALLNKGAILSKHALSNVADEGSVQITNLFLQKIPSNELPVFCSYALHAACCGGHSGVVQALIRGGANIDAKCPKGTTAVISAIRLGRGHIVKLLLSQGATLNLEYEAKYDPLCIAAEHGHANVVHLLLHTGVKPSKTDHAENDALYIAAIHGHVKVMRLLLSNADSPFGDEALIMAASRGRTRAVKLLLESIKSKQQLHSKLNVLNRALEYAVFGLGDKWDKISKVLLDYGADINAIVDVDASLLCEVLSRWGKRPSERNIKDTFDTLIRYGADVNKRDDRGTPLDVALQEEYWTVVETLIRCGAEATPMYRAMQPRVQRELEINARYAARGDWIRQVRRPCTYQRIQVYEGRTYVLERDSDEESMD